MSCFPSKIWFAFLGIFCWKILLEVKFLGSMFYYILMECPVIFYKCIHQLLICYLLSFTFCPLFLTPISSVDRKRLAICLSFTLSPPWFNRRLPSIESGCFLRTSSIIRLFHTFLYSNDLVEITSILSIFRIVLLTST